MFCFIGLPPTRPRLLVPLASSHIQAQAFHLYSPGSLQGKLYKIMGRWAGRTGLLSLMGRIIRRNAGQFDVPVAIQPILQPVMLQTLQMNWQNVIGVNSLTFALAWGKPSPYQKAAALIFDPEGKAVALAKIGATEKAQRLIENERFTLQRLQTVGVDCARFPMCYGHGKVGSVSWLLQEPILEGRPSPNDLKEAHFSFLAAFARATVHDAGSVPSAGSFQAHFTAMLDHKPLPVKADFKGEAAFIDRIAAICRDAIRCGRLKPGPFTAAHGDFAPWNLRSSSGRLTVFDWEYFLPSVPAGWDILHFVFRVENLIRRQPLQKIFERYVAGAYQDSLSLWEKQAGLTVADRELLGMMVLLAIATEFIPEWICRERIS